MLMHIPVVNEKPPVEASHVIALLAVVIVPGILPFGSKPESIYRSFVFVQHQKRQNRRVDSVPPVNTFSCVCSPHKPFRTNPVVTVHRRIDEIQTCQAMTPFVFVRPDHVSLLP
jgi:hypothetical protein